MSLFQNIADAIKGLKNLGQMLEELRVVRTQLQQYADQIKSYANTIQDIKKQLDSILSRLPFR